MHCTHTQIYLHIHLHTNTHTHTHTYTHARIGVVQHHLLEELVWHINIRIWRCIR